VLSGHVRSGRLTGGWGRYLTEGLRNMGMMDLVRWWLRRTTGPASSASGGLAGRPRRACGPARGAGFVWRPRCDADCNGVEVYAPCPGMGLRMYATMVPILADYCVSVGLSG